MIFLGNLFDRKEEKKLLENSKVGLPNADNTLQWNIIDGLIEEKQKIKIINFLPVGTYPKKYKKIFLKDKIWEYKNCTNIEIGSINISLIKQIQRSSKCQKILKKNNDKNILIYSLDIPLLKSIYKLDKSYQITVIVTDLPKYYDQSDVNAIRRYLLKIYNKNFHKYLKRVDKFILLTKYMKDELNIGTKPYIVMEGCCNKNKIEVTKNKSQQRILLYAGTLNYKYGISNLLDAFENIKNNNYQLWICGSGEAEKNIIEKSKKDKRIKFLGYVSKEEMQKIQSEATILINPRQNNGEYTKYSFPSKTIEYLITGKPIIMYKLDGIPDEYDDYVYYVEGNTIEDLKKKIIEVCSKNNEELFEFGIKSQNWILKNKNYQTQAKRIINLIKNK